MGVILELFFNGYFSRFKVNNDQYMFNLENLENAEMYEEIKHS